MTRKRLIKLLMARGTSRNWCAETASNIRAFGIPYAAFWHYLDTGEDKR